MRKAISLFLVLSVLCIATSAMASKPTVDDGGVNANRTSTRTFYTGTLHGRKDDMPGFRPGDTISFRAKSLTEGEQLTVVSYKCNDTNLSTNVTLSDSNVQYINQYTISGDYEDIQYTIRNQAAGIYCLKLKDSGGGDVATFYYKIGNITTPVTIPANGDPYTLVDYHDGTYSIGFIGKVTITGSPNVDLGDIGVSRVGFTFTAPTSGDDVNANVNGASQYVAASTIDDYFNDLIENEDVELGGDYSVIYGMTIFNVPQTYKDSIKATAVAD